MNWDDADYVTHDPTVVAGLSWRGAGWAFTTFHASNWHPLTWLSHMLDCQVYGLGNPGGHHATNVLLHAASTVLLFLAFEEMTGAAWRSAFVAAVFAVHPLHVESVAWVAERKDVLSGLFFMLALWIHGRRASRGKAGRAALAAVFALGLMAKPSLVTLPCVLLLLDYWPLGRMNRGSWRGLAWEKAPLFALSAASCAVTVLAQGKAMMPMGRLPLSARLANATWSYIAYLWQTVWPVDLVAFYPLRIPPPWAWMLAAALLAGASAGAFALRKSQPWLLVGWLWYLGTLAPMIGVLQVGGQARADRYMYLAQTGLVMAGTWWAAGLFRARRLGPATVSLAAAAVLGALAVCAYGQAGYWKDSETLWRHALACTRRNTIAHNMLGVALERGGLGEEALRHFQVSLAINPNDAGTHNHMGVLLARVGALKEAVAHFDRSLDLSPNDPGAETDLGLALAQEGKVPEAVAHYRKALAIEPDFTDAQNNLAWALATTPEAGVRDGAQAVKIASRACDLTDGKNAGYLDTLAAAQAESGDFPAALETARKALAGAREEGLRAEIAGRLEAYEKRLPWRQAAAPAR